MYVNVFRLIPVPSSTQQLEWQVNGTLTCRFFEHRQIELQRVFYLVECLLCHSG